MDEPKETAFSHAYKCLMRDGQVYLRIARRNSIKERQEEMLRNKLIFGAKNKTPKG